MTMVSDYTYPRTEPKTKAEEDFITVIDALVLEHGVTLTFMRDVIALKLSMVSEPLVQEQVAARKAAVVGDAYDAKPIKTIKPKKAKKRP